MLDLYEDEAAGIPSVMKIYYQVDCKHHFYIMLDYLMVSGRFCNKEWWKEENICLNIYFQFNNK